ncbi:MAG TPA: short chain dehydrogenase [Candidatus Tumulicola sp.]|jgi:NAD(P)-dependent dehydrogenase (short-subunit alcohol dehydrogenase family)
MKILLIGASGTIGKAIAAELSSRHEIVAAGRSSGDYRVDITDLQSVRDLYAAVGKVDAVACAAGNVHFGPLEAMTPEMLSVGIGDKLMGQVNLVLAGRGVVDPNGSFTLISGVLSHDPIRFGASASMVNGAVDSFVRAAAIELRQRINAVSPTVLEESMGSYGDYFRGFEAVPARRVGLAFSKSIEGSQTGQIYPVL